MKTIEPSVAFCAVGSAQPPRLPELKISLRYSLQQLFSSLRAFSVLSLGLPLLLAVNWAWGGLVLVLVFSHVYSRDVHLAKIVRARFRVQLLIVECENL